MAINAGESYANILKSGKRDRLQLHVDITFGSGVVGSILGDDPAITAANGGTGIVNITFPKAPSGRIQSIVLFSSASTVKTVWVTNFSATAGTATIVTGNGGGTATNPASSDNMYVTIELETRVD